MRANYFRYLYENTSKGTVYTISSAGSETEFCGYYVCGYGETVFRKEIDERFLVCNQEISIMVLEGLCDTDRSRMADFMKRNKICHLIVPYGEETHLFEDQAEHLTILEQGQSFEYSDKGVKIWMKCCPNGEKGTIVLFCDAKQENAEDCKMSVWPFHKETKISVCVDREDHSCEMQNCLYNDFDLCKGHNGKDSPSYVTGALFLGNMNWKENQAILSGDLERLKEEIRFITLPCGGNDTDFNSELLDMLETEKKRLNYYYILPGEGEQKDHTIGQILRRGIRNRVLLTREEEGLCAAGFFVENMEE